MLQVAAIYFVVLALTGGEQTSRAAWLSLLLLAVSIVGRALVNRFTQLQQTTRATSWWPTAAWPSATN